MKAKQSTRFSGRMVGTLEGTIFETDEGREIYLHDLLPDVASEEVATGESGFKSYGRRGRFFITVTFDGEESSSEGE